MKDQKKITVNFQLKEDVVNLIDSYGKTLGLNRSQMLRNLVLSGLDDAKVLKATGVLDVVGLLKSANKRSGPVPTVHAV